MVVGSLNFFLLCSISEHMTLTFAKVLLNEVLCMLHLSKVFPCHQIFVLYGTYM